MLKRMLSKEVEDFATGLARDFAKRFPADKPVNPRPIGLAKAVDEVCNRATEFQRSHRLGIYGKARMGTAFKLQLKESGYPAEFVDELTQRLLMRISGAR